MPALIVIGCIILFFAFILSLKARITVEYNDEVSLFLRVLFVKIRILPKKDKASGPRSMSKRGAQAIKKRLAKKAEKKRLKKLKKAEKKREKQKLREEQPKKKKSLDDILDMISTVRDVVEAVIKTFFGHLRIDLARLHITVAAEDAATTAIYYGVICDALTHLLPVLESAKGFRTPRTRDISVNTDFLTETMRADVKISMSIRVWHVLHVALAALIKLIPHLVKKQAKQQSK